MKQIESKYYLAVFESRNHAIQLHQYLQRSKLMQFELVSTPCKIKAGCSYSIKFDNLNELEILLMEARAFKKEIASVYLVQRSYGKRVIKKLDVI
jgi:hypothetical protein